jgi:hypothetical protein
VKVLIVPGAPALLSQYASIEDPIPELRGAVRAAVPWLTEDGPASFARATPSSHRIAVELLGKDLDADARDLLVVANGTATRTEKAPGHLNPRAQEFDDFLGRALAEGDLAALRSLTDDDLARELWAWPDADLFRTLGHRISAVTDVQVDYDDAPYGVQYWVVRWECAD